VERVSVDELARDPVGKYVAGEKFVHFCATPKLWGVILWGRPEQADALLLGRSLVLELNAPAEPHASLIDATRLEGADVAAFHALERYLTRFAEPLSRQVLRLALMRPPGLGGAMVTGVYEVVPRPYPVGVFDTSKDAIAWLREGSDLGDFPASLADELARIHGEVTETPALLGQLRTVLDGHLRGLSIAEAARALGVSERTLQRRLTESGTSFSSELGQARVRAALNLLRESDASLTTIALEVGCASLQHFNALFRSRIGESPSAWRKRHRTVT